jgi:hypothetical protein
VNPETAGAQSGQGDRDQPADRGPRRQAARGGERMQAVAGQFGGRYVTPDVTALHAVGQQVSEEVAQMLLGPDEMLAPVQEGREFAAVMLVADERISLERRFEALASAACPVPDLGEMLEVTGDLAFVPGGQDRFDVREVLVQRRPADAGLRRDLRHRYRRQSMLGHQCRHGVQGRVAHRAAVRLDRLRPQLGHQFSIQVVAFKTI